MNTTLPRIQKIRCFISLFTRGCATKNYKYEIKSERLEEIAKSPSGWVPPADPPPDLPFAVERSRTNNLPVYVSYKRNRQYAITTVRKVRGDLKLLEKLVRERIGDNYHYQINELTSQLHIKGKVKDPIVRLLKELGF